MSTSGIARASRTERALERLEAAVARLDDALETTTQGNSGGSDVDDLRQENSTLKALNREAAEALGGAIGKLEALAQSAKEA